MFAVDLNYTVQRLLSSLTFWEPSGRIEVDLFVSQITVQQLTPFPRSRQRIPGGAIASSQPKCFGLMNYSIRPRLSTFTRNEPFENSRHCRCCNIRAPLQLRVSTNEDATEPSSVRTKVEHVTETSVELRAQFLHFESLYREHKVR